MDLRPVSSRSWLHALAAVALIAGPAACAGSAGDAPATTPHATATPDDEPKENTDDTGTLDIYCNPPTKVLVDGKPAGTTPISQYKVKPGRHDVTFADEKTGNRTMSITVAPSEGQTVTSDRPPVLSEVLHKSEPPEDKKKK